MNEDHLIYYGTFAFMYRTETPGVWVVLSEELNRKEIVTGTQAAADLCQKWDWMCKRAQMDREIELIDFQIKLLEELTKNDLTTTNNKV